MAWQKSEVTRNCTCRWFERAAAEPGVPIRFDEEAQAYEMVGENHSVYAMYFCPFCGCKAPESKTRSNFAEMTDAELRRLHELTKGVKTYEDAIRVLGQPEHDVEGGAGETSRGSETESPRATFSRLLRYESLSTTIDVDIAVPAQGPVGVSFSGKYVGPAKGDG